MTGRAPLIALLMMLGIGWGATQPLAKIAVSEGYRHFGLVFWQLAIGAVVLGIVSLFRRKWLPVTGPHLRFYALIALIGTVLPNSASYQAAVHLPAGIMSIVISLVPMFAFPIALLLATDRFGWARLLGLLLGLAGVALIVGPEASLPERAMIFWVPIAMIAPAFYALEGNVVAKWGTLELDAVQVLFGASVVGAIITLPLTLVTGQWIDPRPPWGCAGPWVGAVVADPCRRLYNLCLAGGSRRRSVCGAGQLSGDWVRRALGNGSVR